MQHFILHCGALEQTRHSFINEIRELVGSVNNEKLLGLILDPSTAGVHEENRDSYWESRHVYFRLHVVGEPKLRIMQKHKKCTREIYG